MSTALYRPAAAADASTAAGNAGVKRATPDRVLRFVVSIKYRGPSRLIGHLPPDVLAPSLS